MRRAAILIGVSKTGNLQQLQAVERGVKAMKLWTQTQKFAYVKTLTDAKKPLRVQEIKDEINKIVEDTGYEQLIVYFAGHGVNVGMNERWLLSEAPRDTGAAVNVPGSEALARYCNIPHIVFISDACRTAADSIQAQGVTGNDIFPNTGDGGLAAPVDLFFACTLGSPSLEIKDPATAAKSYEAVYTRTLVDALNGKEAEVLEKEDAQHQVVRPLPLKKYLVKAVARRLIEEKIRPTITQTPDARLTSEPTAWLSRLTSIPKILEEEAAEAAPLTAWPEEELRRGPPSSPPQPPPSPQPPLPANLHAVAATILDEALAGKTPTVDPTATDAPLLSAALQQAATPFGPTHFETECGFKLRGNTIAAAISRDAHTQIFNGDLVRIALKNNLPAANVFLTFTNRTSVVLPALRHYLTGLTFEDGELVTVTYEPADTSFLWPAYEMDDVRQLRAVIASAARFGVFRLGGENALELARRIQFAKAKDPSMALYAAYAYYDLHKEAIIKEMQGYLYEQLRIRFFDIALLARTPRPITNGMYPFCPMLWQGWALLRALEAPLPPAVQGIEQDLLPSLWTLFGPRATDTIQRAWANGEVF